MKILLDMDGVLVNFIKGVSDLLGFDVEPNSHDNFYVKTGMIAAEFWPWLNSKGETFWAQLEKYPWSDDLVDMCLSKGEVFICTSPARSPWSAHGKMLWISKHYPQLKDSMVITKHKYLLSSQGHILIDDTTEQHDDFIFYGCGMAILFPQPWNNNKGKDRLSYVSERLVDLK